MDLTLTAVDLDGGLANPVMQLAVGIWSLFLTGAVVAVLSASIPYKVKSALVAAVAGFGFLGGPAFYRFTGTLIYALISKSGRSVGFFGGPSPLVAPVAAVLMGSVVQTTLMVWRRRREPRIATTEPPSDSQSKLLRCSFCNKSQRNVKKLIAGPAVQICDECVDICLDIIAEDRKDAPSEPEEASRDPMGSVGYPTSSSTPIPTPCSLCQMPMPLDHALPVHNRGLLCPGCVGAIEAAIAAARPRGGTG